MTWKPGQSGNPAGGPGPQNKPYRDALRMEVKALANREMIKHPRGSLRSIAQARLLAACEGGRHRTREIADRLDGRVPQPHGGDNEGPPIRMIITGVPRAGDPEPPVVDVLADDKLLLSRSGDD